MRLYPAIDLREGATVQLVGGDIRHEKVHEPDPVKVAHRWASQGASTLHVVDLDAALGLGTNLHVVERILRAVPLPMQLGGGVRHLVDIQRRLDMGVGRIIIGTQGIRHPDWLKTAAELYPGKIVLAVDARGDEVVVSGWTEGSGLTVETVLDRSEDVPLAGILFTNVDVEGRMEGVDRAAVERVVRGTHHKVIASGGIAGVDDLDTLKDVGCDAAVLGMSIYTGAIELKSAIERIEGRAVTASHVLLSRPELQWDGLPEGRAAARLVYVQDGDPDEVDDEAVDDDPEGYFAGDAVDPDAEESATEEDADAKPDDSPAGALPLWRRRPRKDENAEVGS